MKRLMRDYSLSISLTILFLGAWALQTWAGWVKFVSEQQDQGQVPQIFGNGGYFYVWLGDTMQNWQSEFLGIVVFVVLTTYLIHKDSPESRDSDDKQNEKLDEILRRLDRLEQANPARDTTYSNGVAARNGDRTTHAALTPPAK